MALSSRLIEFTLPRLLMLGLVCLTAPPLQIDKEAAAKRNAMFG
tara:strand:- start:598 stop:729 length:132 start_codon:yes stop_codon:yes gene_type:complete